MVMLSATIDVWTVLLAVGILASVCTVVMIVNSATGVRPAPRPPTPPIATRGVRASASARAASAAAEQLAGTRLAAIAVPSPRALTAGNDSGPTRPGGDGGQPAPRPDGPGPDQRADTAQAVALVAHFAEHDPGRIAEVITQWIRSDQNTVPESAPTASRTARR